MKLGDLNLLQKRVVLYNMYIKDGADPETASNTAEHCRTPMIILRKHFNFDEETEIIPELLNAGD
jgi:hypothetical protein